MPIATPPLGFIVTPGVERAIYATVTSLRAQEPRGEMVLLDSDILPVPWDISRAEAGGVTTTHTGPRVPPARTRGSLAEALATSPWDLTVVLPAGDRVQPGFTRAVMRAGRATPATASILCAPYLRPPTPARPHVVPREVDPDPFSSALRGFVPPLSALVFDRNALTRLVPELDHSPDLELVLARQALLLARPLRIAVRHIAAPPALSARHEEGIEAERLRRLFSFLEAQIDPQADWASAFERTLLEQSWAPLTLAPAWSPAQRPALDDLIAAGLRDAFELAIVQRLRFLPAPPRCAEAIVHEILASQQLAPRLYDSLFTACNALRKRGVLLPVGEVTP